MNTKFVTFHHRSPIKTLQLQTMFKKHINASNTRQLGGKDAKKLRGDVARLYPSLTEEHTAVLFPSKAGITLSKLSNRSIVYGRDDGVPLFFDPNGHGDKLIPTVGSLHLVHSLFYLLIKITFLCTAGSNKKK